MIQINKIITHGTLLLPAVIRKNICKCMFENAENWTRDVAVGPFLNSGRGFLNDGDFSFPVQVGFKDSVVIESLRGFLDTWRRVLVLGSQSHL